MNSNYVLFVPHWWHLISWDFYLSHSGDLMLQLMKKKSIFKRPDWCVVRFPTQGVVLTDKEPQFWLRGRQLKKLCNYWQMFAALGALLINWQSHSNLIAKWGSSFLTHLPVCLMTKQQRISIQISNWNPFPRFRIVWFCFWSVGFSSAA